MANLTVASDEYQELVINVAKEMGLKQDGIEFQTFNVKKSKKEVIKVKRASETEEILGGTEDTVIVFIYEDAFDRVDEAMRYQWVRMALDPVSYDSEKNAGLDSVGWYLYNSINGTTGDTSPSDGEQGYGTHQVGKKAPNRLGLYDMSGNVMEWCYDLDGTITTTTPADGATSGDYRVTHGGRWDYNANIASVSYRGSILPDNRTQYLGFRVVRSFPSTTE
jgi:hypothetical protein